MANESERAPTSISFIVRAIRGCVFIAYVVSLAGCSPSCFLSPKTEFGDVSLPNAPDYTQDKAWAALPHKEDRSDYVPLGETPRTEKAPADVFVIHPTSWYDRRQWNGPYDSPVAAEVVDHYVMAGQASAFQCLLRSVGTTLQARIHRSVLRRAKRGDEGAERSLRRHLARFRLFPCSSRRCESPLHHRLALSGKPARHAPHR